MLSILQFLLYCSWLQCKLCMVWRKLMSELESTLQQHCLAALDCLLFSSLKLGLALHRELITVFSKTKNTVICNLSSFKNTLVGTCPLQPASNINILLPRRYTASTSMYKYITKNLMLFFFFFPQVSRVQNRECWEYNLAVLELTQTSEDALPWVAQIQSCFGNHHPPYSVCPPENRRCYSSVQS